MSDYHFQPDGQGGFHVTDVGRIRAERNALSAIKTIVIWFPILAGLYKLYEIISPYDKIILDFLIPGISFLGIVQYPIIRGIDRLRGLRYRQRPVLRRINRICLILWIVPVLLILFPLLLILISHFDPHFFTHLMGPAS